MSKAITGETKIFDVEDWIGRLKSTYTIIYQHMWEEVGDEVQQGRGNMLGTCGTIVARGRAGEDDDDDDEVTKKKKEFDPMDKTPQKKKPLEEEEGEVEALYLNPKKA